METKWCNYGGNRQWYTLLLIIHIHCIPVVFVIWGEFFIYVYFFCESSFSFSQVHVAVNKLFTSTNWHSTLHQTSYKCRLTTKLTSSFFSHEVSFPVAQLVEHGVSNAKIMGLIPRESKSWSNVETVTWMHCKSLWIKVSAKCKM